MNDHGEARHSRLILPGPSLKIAVDDSHKYGIYNYNE